MGREKAKLWVWVGDILARPARSAAEEGASAAMAEHVHHVAGAGAQEEAADAPVLVL
jgi:hypothetical protein